MLAFSFSTIEVTQSSWFDESGNVRLGNAEPATAIKSLCGLGPCVSYERQLR